MYEENNPNIYQNTQAGGFQQQSGYQNPGMNPGGFVNNPVPPKEPKKMSTFGKVMMAICMGLLFGLFAGCGFYAVQLAMGEVRTITSTSDAGTSLDKEDAESAVPSLNLADPLLSTGEAQVTILTKEETDLTGVVADVMPSMVSITEYYTVTTNYWGQSFSQDGEASGSGIIIGETDDEYIIVTNNHVVSDSDSLEITFIDDSKAPAYLKGLDASTDVAVIAVMKSDLDAGTMNQIKVAQLGDSDSLVLGQNVIAIGNALGYGQSVTTGIISALNREITTSDGNTQEYIQTDAAINPGNSGGALLNMAGQVIGINSNKIGGSSVEGMGYAIPISAVRDTIEEFMGRDTLVEVDEDDIGYIGIYMQEVTDEISTYYGIPVGIYVSEVADDSGAKDAGIEAGDVIVNVNGNTVKTIDALQRLMKYYAVGDTIDVTFMRNERGEYTEHTVSVTLGEKPEGVRTK